MTAEEVLLNDWTSILNGRESVLRRLAINMIANPADRGRNKIFKLSQLRYLSTDFDDLYTPVTGASMAMHRLSQIESRSDGKNVR
jgi:hypothetical protein